MLKNLYYFVSVIETGSYSKAAELCGVGQPAVSKGIRKLECEMDALLVDYHEARCVPTQSGQICYEQAKELITRYDNMKRLIKKQNQVIEGQLALIYLTFGYLKVFTPVQSGFGARYPGVKFNIHYDSYTNAKKLLDSGEIDGFLVSAAEVEDNLHGEAVIVHHSRMIALIPKWNSLADRKEILLSDLCNEKLIIFDPTVVPILSAAYHDYCIDAGFTPYIISYGKKVGELATKVILNNAIALVDDSSSYAAGEELVAVPILGSFPKLDICLIWNRHHVRREMQALVDYCRGAL